MGLPDLDCAPGGSYRSDLPPHPCQCLSGPRCTHTGNCHSHSECLEKKDFLSLCSFLLLKAKVNLNWRSPTITIDVNSTGVALSIVVSVCLVGVGFKHTVVTSIPNIVTVCIILGWVVNSWAVVLIL